MASAGGGSYTEGDDQEVKIAVTGPDNSERKASLARLRVPLPAKLLSSYVLLLAVAAVPNFVYVTARLEHDLVADATRDLLDTAQMSAGVLAPLSPADRVARARDLAHMTGDRVTLFGPAGEVLFDSEPAAAPDRDPVEMRDAAATGRGTARRADNGADALFAAARLPVSREAGTPVVRVARPLAAVRSSTESLTRFARNIEAAAISLAIFLSVVAAVRFQRPLRRVIAAAKALGAGDLAARTGVSSNDEVGDAGRAIDGMAAEIRRRLANAGSADAVVAQLVDALPLPCVIFEVDGEVLSLNGPARAVLRLEGPNASRRLKELTASETFERALAAAEDDGEPEPIDVEVAPGAVVRGTVHVLKRPGVPPLYVLLGRGPVKAGVTTLPGVEGVRSLAFADLLKEAEGDASGSFAHAGVDLAVTGAPSVLVVDVGHRVQRALSACLSGCARALEGRQRTLAVDVTVDDTSVQLALEADLGRDALAQIRPLLEPLGGGVEVDTDGTTLRIPRA